MKLRTPGIASAGLACSLFLGGCSALVPQKISTETTAPTEWDDYASRTTTVYKFQGENYEVVSSPYEDRDGEKACKRAYKAWLGNGIVRDMFDATEDLGLIIQNGKQIGIEKWKKDSRILITWQDENREMRIEGNSLEKTKRFLDWYLKHKK